MAVTTNTVIQKMMKEVQELNKQQMNQQVMMQHVANVKLLCELLLDEEGPSVTTSSDISAREMKAMMGTSTHPSVRTQSDHETIDHDEANGKSIFDF
ncbi:DUF5327 family protein [Lentibacillus sp. Marseille-P4043]|uniref:DUF5327 family protein n=1 Tax=Lentibacillus sp. Marseille-P4043 TaxID=2040293 RepID=UPI000D0AFA49|nr:DUF5327 family protein [Lentibacillus sp. Marseille-P4043]